MKKLLAPLIIVAMVLAACQSAPEPEIVEVTVPVEVTREVTRIITQPPKAVEVTVLVTVPPPPTYTPYPTYTPCPTYTPPPLPTATPEPSPTPTPAETAFLKRDLDLELDRGGVIIRLTLISFALLEDASDELKDTISYFDSWDNVVIMGGMEIEVTNTTQDKISVYPAQGTIVAGNEQVDIDLWLSEDVGGDLFEGVMKTGVVVFGLKRIDVTELDSIQYIVRAPVNADTYERLTDEDYEFVIPLR